MAKGKKEFLNELVRQYGTCLFISLVAYGKCLLYHREHSSCKNAHLAKAVYFEHFWGRSSKNKNCEQMVGKQVLSLW